MALAPSRCRAIRFGAICGRLEASPRAVATAPYYELSPGGSLCPPRGARGRGGLRVEAIRGVDVPASVQEDHGPVAIEARGAAAPRGRLGARRGGGVG